MSEIVEAGWAKALEPVADRVAAMGDFLRAEIAAGRTYLPAGSNVLRAFQQPFDDVRVLIVGQDPYPTPGHAVGLSFSVGPDVRPLPGSLINIFREYSTDLGFPPEEAAILAMRADLMAQLRLTVEKRNWTQVEAAKVLGISQSRVSDLMRGKWDKFSLDMLVTLATRAGLHCELKLAA